MPKRWTSAFAGLALVLLPARARGVTLASQASPQNHEPHVRANDEFAARLLNDALERSKTVRLLFGRIQASNLLVYLIVERGQGLPRGRTSVVSKGGAIRMLHTVIDGTLDSDERICVLGHEFQHVIEIAEAPEVADQDGMRRLFRRIGYQISLRAENYETTAAEAIERRVREEIRRRRAPCHLKKLSRLRPVKAPMCCALRPADPFTRERPVPSREGGSMKSVVLSITSLLAVAAMACADQRAAPSNPASPTPLNGTAAKPGTSDIAVTTVIEDVDASGLATDTSSDGHGAYAHNAGGVKSVLAENANNGLTHGDWQFDAPSATGRKIGISLDPEDAVQPGDPAYLVPATPPFWGTHLVTGGLSVKCTFVNRSMLTMAAGATFTCPLGNHFVYGGIEYGRGPNSSFTGWPEVTDAQVVCNTADAGGCNDWHIEPIGQGRAIGRLIQHSSKGFKKTHIGTFYIRLRIHITRP
jgi:hypothetical protein